MAMKELTPTAELKERDAAGSFLPLPSWRLVIALALPVLAQQGLIFLVNQSDRFLAGHLRVVEPSEQARLLGQILTAGSSGANLLPGADVVSRVVDLEAAWDAARQVSARQMSFQAA